MRKLGYVVCMAAGMIGMEARALAAEETSELLWHVTRGGVEAGDVDLTIESGVDEGDAIDAIPERLYQNPEDGPMAVQATGFLKAGTYELIVRYLVTEEKSLCIRAEVNGRQQSDYETYRFAEPGTPMEYIYPFRVAHSLRHAITVGVAPITGAYYTRFPESFVLDAFAVRPAEPAKASTDMRNRPACDLWGWMACIDYQRPKPETLEYMIRETVNQPWKWGANMVQAYPHFFRKQWQSNWTQEEINEYIATCHERHFLVDEHMGSNPKHTNLAIDLMVKWGEADGNLLKHGWEHVVDTWEAEAFGYALVASKEPLADMIKMNEALWSFNPGTPMNSCDQRPNTWQGGGLAWDTYTRYWGPNFIKTVMCANWNEMVNLGACPVLGYTDMNPLRVYPGGLGLTSEYRDTFIGYQADSRVFSYSPTGRFGSVFGGGTTADMILRQAADMFRPRVLDPSDVHESAIWWLGETPQILPTELRDAVYAASMDPVRQAFTSKLSATGYDGMVPSRRKVLSEAHNEEVVAPWWPDANEAHPASTAFVQNNYFRLLRYAAGDYGVLQFDSQHTAHYDSNGLASDVACGPIGLSAMRSESIEVLANETTPTTTRVESSTDSGLLEIRWEDVESAGAVDVVIDGRVQGRVQIGPPVSYLPVDFGTAGEHEITFRNHFGGSVEIEAVKLLEDRLERGKALLELLPARTAPEFDDKGVVEIDLQDETRVLPARLVAFDEPKQGEDEESDADKEEVVRPDEPKSVLLHFDEREGNYLASFRLTAGQEDTTVRFYRDGWDALNTIFGNEINYKMGWLASKTIPAGETIDWTLPVDFNYTGQHDIELVATEGEVEVERMAFYPAPVTHRWLERGGHRAVLEETLVRETADGMLREVRRYTADNDCPWLRVDVEFGEPDQGGIDPDLVTHVLSVPQYDQCTVDGRAVSDAAAWMTGRVVRLANSAGGRPDLVVIVPDAEIEEGMRWRRGDMLALRPKAGERKLTYYFVAPDVYGEDQLLALADVVAEPLTHIHLRAPGHSTAMRNPTGLPLARTFVVNNPHDGPYLVREGGWWYARGGQPSREHPGNDFLKIYSEPNSQQEVQFGEYVDNVVRPGWGCQYMLALKDVEGDEEQASCTVKVMSATAYVFAPRVEFAEPFTQVTLNGREWPYYDDQFVFLPTKPGVYEVAVKDTGKSVPRLMASSGMLLDGMWDDADSTLRLNIGLQPWTYKIPEDQEYFATINHADYELESVHGAELVDHKEIGASEELRAKMAKRGFTVKFRPTTATDLNAGVISLRFKRR